VTLKDAAPPPVSVEAEAAIRQRSLQAELEAIAYRVAARKITRAVRQMPQKLRLRRLLAHTDAGAAAEQEVAVEQRRSEAKARRAAGKLDEPQPSGQLAGAAGFYMSMLSPGSQVDDRPPSPTPPVAPQSTAEQQPTAAAAAAAATASPAGPEAVAVNEALTLLTPAAAPDAPHNRTSAEAAVTTEREPTIVRLAVGEHGAEEAEEAEAAAAAAIVEAEAAAAAVQAAEAAEAAEVAAMVAAEEEKLQQEMAESERQEMIEAEKRLAEAQAVADEEMVKEAARAAAAEAQARADAEEREKLAAEERDKARRRANGEYVPWVQGEYCPPFTVLLEVKQEEGGEASMFARLLDVEAVEALGKARVRILPQLQGGEVRVSLFLFDPFSGDKLGRAPAWLEELERPLMPMEAARVAKAASRLAAAYKGKIARAKAKVQAERERQRQLERRRIAEFKVKEAKRKTLLRGFDVDEDSDKSVAEQLRDALSKSAVKVVDLFKDWDKDGNGKVSKEEFRKAMGLLGFSVPAEDIDALFDSWDPDGSGVLSMGELDKQLSEHKAQLEAQRKARALKRTQTASVKRLEDGEIDEAAARIAAVRNAQAERRERAAAAAKRRKSKEVSDAALAAETAATEAAAAEAAEATRKKWRMAFKLQKELTRRKLASERRMLAAAAAEAASKLEEAAAEAEPQPAQLGQLDFEAAYSYVVKGHGWQWSAELGCWPAQVGPPLWTAAQAEVYTAQANSTVWKPKIATTASLFHDVSTAQLPPSHSPTAPRVPVPPTALAPTNEASPRPRRRGVVNAVYLKQVRAHSSPELALNHL
jgi:hypothetical protein